MRFSAVGVVLGLAASTATPDALDAAKSYDAVKWTTTECNDFILSDGVYVCHAKSGDLMLEATVQENANMLPFNKASASVLMNLVKPDTLVCENWKKQDREVHICTAYNSHNERAFLYPIQVFDTSSVPPTLARNPFYSSQSMTDVINEALNKR